MKATPFSIHILLARRKDIDEIFAAHGKFSVAILSLEKRDGGVPNPDIQILVNLDEVKEEGVIVCVTKNSQVLQKIPATQRHDFCMAVMLKLSALLGCSVDVVDELGLESFYPHTYSTIYRS